MFFSRRWSLAGPFRALLVVGIVLNLAPVLAYSAEGSAGTSTPDEDETTSSPAMQYGDFKEAEEENASTLFFQYGRFFGVSLAGGYHGLTGNRAKLWRGGFPLVAAKVHYWFDLNLALQMEITYASHTYDNTVQNRVNVSMMRLGLDVKYYFDTKDLSAPIAFSNPYVLVGGGKYDKNETDSAVEVGTEKDSAFGVAVGGGLEFAVSPKKTYFFLEGKYHAVTFKDTYVASYESIGADDLSGGFYSATVGFLFSW